MLSTKCKPLFLSLKRSGFSRCIRDQNLIQGSSKTFHRLSDKRVIGKSASVDAEFNVSTAGKVAMQSPVPGPLQQTLWASFTMAGMGLHSGEVSCVRIRPAFAGDGRYFVKVPYGSILDATTLYEETEIDIEKYEMENLDVDAEVLRSELYLKYLEYKESEGFVGQFSEFLQIYMQMKGIDVDSYIKVTQKEQPIPKSDNEVIIPATLQCLVKDKNPYQTVLENVEQDRVESVECLLAALEACGVDNARIELDGNIEVPTVDGSAESWTAAIQNTGLAAAISKKDDEEVTLRAAMKPDELVKVEDKDAFIMLIPSDKMQLTCGIDHMKEAAVIGRQWYSWCVQDDQDTFDKAIASAKNYFASKSEYRRIAREGFFRGGNENVMIIANGKDWIASMDVQYPNDEPARHRVLELIGNLSLLGKNGMGGIPFGHIISYKADYSLQYALIKLLNEKFSDQYVQYVSEPMTSSQETTVSDVQLNNENES